MFEQDKNVSIAALIVFVTGCLLFLVSYAAGQTKSLTEQERYQPAAEYSADNRFYSC